MVTTLSHRKVDTMAMSIRYKGRSFSSSQSLRAALQRDMKQAVERQIRSAAASSGVRLRKTSSGYEFEGTPEQIARLRQRISK